jgi:hypothetical protein
LGGLSPRPDFSFVRAPPGLIQDINPFVSGRPAEVSPGQEQGLDAVDEVQPDSQGLAALESGRMFADEFEVHLKFAVFNLREDFSNVDFIGLTGEVELPAILDLDLGDVALVDVRPDLE